MSFQKDVTLCKNCKYCVGSWCYLSRLKEEIQPGKEPRSSEYCLYLYIKSILRTTVSLGGRNKYHE